MEREMETSVFFFGISADAVYEVSGDETDGRVRY